MAFLSKKILKEIKTLSSRTFRATAFKGSFFEESKKDKYEKEIEFHPIKSFKEGFKLLPKEIKKFKEEVKENVLQDKCFGVNHKDFEILWKFNNPSIVEEWIVTNDSDHGEGKSVSNFILNQHKRAVFSGDLSTEVPKDGITKSAGYCNITSPKCLKSFKRTIAYDWSRYTHLLLNVRGDGRNYNIILNMLRDWDVNWNDQYNYILYTRGGPYWQLAKIPFSKFILCSKGRVQDRQEAIQLEKVLSLGITLADDNNGPFKLEIDFIGLIHDKSHTSTFEYEMFEVSPSVLG